MRGEALELCSGLWLALLFSVQTMEGAGHFIFRTSETLSGKSHWSTTLLLARDLDWKIWMKFYNIRVGKGQELAEARKQSHCACYTGQGSAPERGSVVKVIEGISAYLLPL